MFFITFYINFWQISDAVKRKDRQITNKQKIEDFLNEQKVIRIGYYDKSNDEVYIVPLNFGFKVVNDEYIFYFHGGKKEGNLN